MIKYISITLLIISLLVTTTPTYAKEKEWSQGYNNPKITESGGYTIVKWHNFCWCNYYVVTYVATKTPFGVNYKPVPVWYGHLRPMNIRMVFHSTGYRYRIIKTQ